MALVNYDDNRSPRRGTLIAIGGAEEQVRDPHILDEFVALCGGAKGHIAIIPTASQRRDTGARYERTFTEIGIGKVTTLPYEQRKDCEREDWLDVLRTVDGVFLTGGNQLRLSTTLGGTTVARTLRDRHREGLHVAGTSAGAAILSEHMIAFGDKGATPYADMVTLAPGLGLTRRLVIDQHFRQRDRLGRLITALAYNPRAFGIGLDEDTAALLGPADVLEVRGSGALTLVDPNEVEYTSMDSSHRKDPVCVIGLRMHILTAGARFDMQTRQATPAMPARME